MPMSKILAGTILLVGAMAAIAGHTSTAASRLTNFTSVDVDLAFGDRMFPDGPNADAINNNCLACHSAGMILTQPPLPRKVWEAEVEKMRNVYKAPVAEADITSIVDYLTRIKGAD
jgi:hypothetical protein